MTDDVDDLFDQAAGSSRHESEPDLQADADAGDGSALSDAVAAELDAINHGDASNALTFRDEALAALVRAMDQTGQIDETAAELAEALDEDVEDASRSLLLSLAIRYALEDIDHDLLEAYTEGKKQYLLETADDI